MKRKRGLGKLISVLIITLVSVSSIMLTNIKAEDETLEFFVIEKEWIENNDLETKRPNQITVHLVDENGSPVGDGTYVLKASEDWKKTLMLPSKGSDEQDAKYYVYEDEPTLYSGDHTNVLNKLEIKSFKVDDDILNHNLLERTSVTVNDTDGFSNVPVGNIIVDSDLKLNEAKSMELPENFEYTENKRAYGDPTKTSLSDSTVRIFYKGETYPYNSGSETIEVVWDNKATNIYTGEKYGVKLILSDISIKSAAEDDGFDGTNRATSILVNENGNLQVDTYCVEGYTFSSNPKENVFAVSTDISLIVIDESGNPVEGYTQVYITDLDQPDYYYAYKNNSPSTRKFDSEYAERVILQSGVVSDVYENNSGTYLTNNGYEFWGNNPPASNADPKTSIKFLVETEGYKYTWKGSSCTTAILYRSSETNNYPKEEDYTNVLKNFSSLYVVNYFYQTDQGKYNSTPDETDDMKMLKPGSVISVKEDTDLNPKREGYVLDEDTTDLDETVTMSINHKTTAPAVLNVYFKKSYVVTYNDNVDEEVFDKQTNPDLSYGEDTPEFDGNPDIRKGYDFLGWSETPDGDIIDIPEKVTKNADYWAHWKPRTDTKYTVEYYYEVNGRYPKIADDSVQRTGTTEEEVEVYASDLIPQKTGYYLNEKMDIEWKGVVKGDGSLVLRIYFKPKVKPSTITYNQPITGVE